MELEKVKRLVLRNKKWAAVSVFLILMALGVFGIFLSSGNLSSMGSLKQAEYDSSRLSGVEESDQGGSGSYVEVQEGKVQIKSKNIEEDIRDIRSLAKSYGGWIESSSKDHGEIYTNADFTVKVPSEKFQPFINDLKQAYNVESYSVQNYRIYTEREMDELEILNETLRNYDSIRKDVNKMENSEKKLDLLMKVTEKQLTIKEKQKKYQNQLSDKRQRGNYATININLKEERKIDLVPENLGQRFKSEVNDMVDTVANTLITTLTDGIELFLKAIKYLIFLLIVTLPASIAYKLARKIYYRFV